MYSDKCILIGIYWPAFADMEHVVNTLHTLNLSQGKLNTKVLVLYDGPNVRTISEMPGEPVIIRNDAYRGKAYCFNRLTSYMSTLPVDFFVF